MGKKSRLKKEKKELEKKQQLGTLNNTVIKGKELNKIYKNKKSNIDEQYERIFKILEVQDEDDAVVNYENLKKYLEFIKNEIELPLIVTGIEDLGCFSWEEYYNFGPGNQQEYEKLKEKYPSFRDKYLLICFEEDFDEEEGLYVKVKRTSDNKKFTLTLADLEAVDENTKNAQILDDHAVWYTNFRF